MIKTYIIRIKINQIIIILSDISGIDPFDENGNKLAGEYSNIITFIPKEEVFDKKEIKLYDYLEKFILKFLMKMYTSKMEIKKKEFIRRMILEKEKKNDKNGNKLEGKYSKVKSYAPND